VRVLWLKDDRVEELSSLTGSEPPWIRPVPSTGCSSDVTLDSVREHAEAIVREAVAEVERRQPTVQCEGEIVEGHPAAVLVHEADDADLIVLRNRGYGGFASLMLGAVSQQVVHHAPVPRAHRPSGAADVS
jgi:nucleotide-binding universal stress UspA family protein